MPDSYSTLKQQRTALLAQIAALNRMQRGRLSEQLLQARKTAGQ